MTSLAGKVAIVTGSSRGIGRAIAPVSLIASQAAAPSTLMTKNAF